MFLVARLDGEAVGCGALRPVGPRAVELKRMWVRPAARQRGVGRALLAALEDEARAAGATRVLVESGDAQPEALALYDGAGYERVPCPPGHPRSVCFERDL